VALKLQMLLVARVELVASLLGLLAGLIREIPQVVDGRHTRCGTRLVT
jgi:type III secretory pathway component EscS